MIDWHVAVVMGKDPRWLYDDDGALIVVYDATGGIAPTLDQKRASVEWLANRGYGMPVQTLLLDQEIRTQLESGPQVQVGELGRATFHAINALLSAPPRASVIDATSIDRDELRAIVEAPAIPADTSSEDDGEDAIDLEE